MPIEAIETSPLPHARTVAHEQVANETKHWVRLTAACNSRCIFCLDAEAQDGRFMAFDAICTEILRGREENGATRLVVSGGEGSIHPRFHDAVRYGKSVGYRWVQTVTNGQKLAERAFFLAAMDAGLDEITFSLHGHTAVLHDRLTRTKNGFENLMKAMMRAVRDGRPVVNVDVCINRQNVEHLEAIVALCARVGVKEFDLLHVIPQGEAWANRDELFYDPEEHRESLRRVFLLGRRPDFHIWTNRFPVSHLEDLEELIQDPHKMFDEVGGRRTQFRRYLDSGRSIDCRDPARCPHCFIEPFCTTLDHHLADQQAGEFDVWWVGAAAELAAQMPCGTRLPGVSSLAAAEALAGTPVYLRAGRYTRHVSLPIGSRLILEHVDDLDVSVSPGVEVEVHLDRTICATLVRRTLPAHWVLHAPSRGTAAAAAALDPDWRAFFATLPPGARAQNLASCLCPGAVLERPLRILDAGLFHADGRMAIAPFVEEFVGEHYRVKSFRCRTCQADGACEGGHIQSIRAAGFRQLVPLPPGDETEVRVQRLRAIHRASPRLRNGAPAQPGSVRVTVAGASPVPFIDDNPGRRS